MALSRSVTEPKAPGIDADNDVTWKIYAFEPELLEVEENPGNLYDNVSAQRRSGKKRD